MAEPLDRERRNQAGGETLHGSGARATERVGTREAKYVVWGQEVHRGGVREGRWLPWFPMSILSPVAGGKGWGVGRRGRLASDVADDVRRL